MRSRNRTKLRSTSAAEIAALTKYHGFALPAVDRQIAAMAGFLAHRLAFILGDDDASALAAGRAWLQDAAILATMPASSVGEAHRKITHLEEQLDRWVRQTAREHAHEAVLAMIETSIASERTRWGLNASGAEPNIH